jgi:hypothetical protein
VQFLHKTCLPEMIYCIQSASQLALSRFGVLSCCLASGLSLICCVCLLGCSICPLICWAVLQPKHCGCTQQPQVEFSEVRETTAGLALPCSRHVS